MSTQTKHDDFLLKFRLQHSRQLVDRPYQEYEVGFPGQYWIRSLYETDKEDLHKITFDDWANLVPTCNVDNIKCQMIDKVNGLQQQFERQNNPLIEQLAIQHQKLEEEYTQRCNKMT